MAQREAEQTTVAGFECAQAALEGAKDPALLRALVQDLARECGGEREGHDRRDRNRDDHDHGDDSNGSEADYDPERLRNALRPKETG